MIKNTKQNRTNKAARSKLQVENEAQDNILDHEDNTNKLFIGGIPPDTNERKIFHLYLN